MVGVGEIEIGALCTLCANAWGDGEEVGRRSRTSFPLTRACCPGGIGTSTVIFIQARG